MQYTDGWQMSAFNGVAMVFAENKVALSMQIPLNIFF